MPCEKAQGVATVMVRVLPVLLVASREVRKSVLVYDVTVLLVG